MPTEVVSVRIPLRNAPRPKAALVAAGEWRTLWGNRTVSVAAQTGRVIGWRDSHPDRQTILNVEVTIDE